MTENNQQKPHSENEDLERTSSELEQEGIVIEDGNTPLNGNTNEEDSSSAGDTLTTDTVKEELLNGGGVEVLRDGKRIEKEEGEDIA